MEHPCAQLVKDIAKLESRITSIIFTKYIQPKHPELTLEQFRKTIYQPNKSQPLSQDELIAQENDELDADEDIAETRCNFVILHKNKLRRCKLKQEEDEYFCYLHLYKENIFSRFYFDLKQKLDSK